MEIPCNQCTGCQLVSAHDWATRCKFELHDHRREDGTTNASFVTLTFSDQGLMSRWAEEGTRPETLSKRDWQLFAKRLRRWQDTNNRGSFRYLMSGEYGDENQRPHYHALVFGEDFDDSRTLISKRGDNPMWVSPILTELWPYGFHSIQAVTTETIAYVCRYTLKKISGNSEKANEERIKRYARTDWTTGECFMVEPEFATMSLKPGIGSAFWNNYKTDLYPSDYVVNKGRRGRVPKYYESKLKREDEAMLKRIKERRREKAIERAPNNTPERRKTRDLVLQARLKNRSTKL